MDKEQKRMWQLFGRYGSIGIEMTAIFVISVLFGRKLDTWFGTHPWGMIFFLIVAIGATIKLFMRITKDYFRDEL